MDAIINGMMQLWTSTGLFGFLFPDAMRASWGEGAAAAGPVSADAAKSAGPNTAGDCVGCKP